MMGYILTSMIIDKVIIGHLFTFLYLVTYTDHCCYCDYYNGVMCFFSQGWFLFKV